MFFKFEKRKENLKLTKHATLNALTIECPDCKFCERTKLLHAQVVAVLCFFVRSSNAVVTEIGFVPAGSGCTSSKDGHDDC